MSEKLQKILAAAGLGSRREMEHWIRAGRVSLDGRIAVLGDRADRSAVICVDGRRIPATAASQIRIVGCIRPLSAEPPSWP